VAAALERQGHEAVMWSPDLPFPAGRFHTGILANAGYIAPAARWCDDVLWVSHGIIPAEEPPQGACAFTSEGVRDHWGRQGPVIRQPIDLDFWTPGPGLRRLVRYSYRGGLAFLPALAERMGMAFTHLQGVTHEQAREVLRGAACVLATGRAALEAMAVGVPVVILDHRSAYQGPLLDPDTLGSVARNYSGRGGVAPTPATVEAAIRVAVQRGSLRAHVEAHHDASKIAGSLVEMAR
jgi:hypothetical protein